MTESAQAMATLRWNCGTLPDPGALVPQSCPNGHALPPEPAPPIPPEPAPPVPPPPSEIALPLPQAALERTKSAMTTCLMRSIQARFDPTNARCLLGPELG